MPYLYIYVYLFTHIGVKHYLIVSVALRVSIKMRKLLTLREHLDSPRLLFGLWIVDSSLHLPVSLIFTLRPKTLLVPLSVTSTSNIFRIFTLDTNIFFSKTIYCIKSDHNIFQQFNWYTSTYR